MFYLLTIQCKNVAEVFEKVNIKDLFFFAIYFCNFLCTFAAIKTYFYEDKLYINFSSFDGMFFLFMYVSSIF